MAMSNVITAKVQIEGTRSMLWHRFGPDALPLEKPERTGVAGHDPEEWRRTVLVTRDGQLYIEPTYVFSCMREGAKYTKKGRASLMKPMSATLQVEDQRVLINRWFPGFPNGNKFDVEKAEPPKQDFELPVYLDVRGVVNPSTRGRNVRYRVAASPGWETEFTLLWDKTIVSRGEMEAIMIDAGRLVGLGNGRGIGFGRFEIASFGVVE